MIREASISDAAACMVVVRRTLRAVQSKFYNDSIISALEQKFDEQYFRNAIKLGNTFVYDVLGTLAVVVVDVSREEIDALFVDPDYLRRGIGSELLSFCHQKAADSQSTELKVYSSMNAVNFFKKHGYQVVEDVDHQQYGRLVLVVKQF